MLSDFRGNKYLLGTKGECRPTVNQQILARIKNGMGDYILGHEAFARLKEEERSLFLSRGLRKLII